jgi:hypothetical protein
MVVGFIRGNKIKIHACSGMLIVRADVQRHILANVKFGVFKITMGTQCLVANILLCINFLIIILGWILERWDGVMWTGLV